MKLNKVQKKPLNKVLCEISLFNQRWSIIILNKIALYMNPIKNLHNTITHFKNKNNKDLHNIVINCKNNKIKDLHNTITHSKNKNIKDLHNKVTYCKKNNKYLHNKLVLYIIKNKLIIFHNQLNNLILMILVRKVLLRNLSNRKNKKIKGRIQI